jgi:hypothetical protein
MLIEYSGEWVIVVKHLVSNFSPISWREHVTFRWNDVCVAQDQHTCLDFYSASSLKQQSVGRHDTLLRHIILMPHEHDHGDPWYDVGNVT